MSGREDLYIVLQVGRAASVNDIKRAFRKLARRYHPDINPGDRTAEEYFKRISEAYEILSDPLKKEFYDLNGFYSDGVLETNGSRTTWGFSFQGFDFSNTAGSTLAEGLNEFMSRRASRNEPERGLDLEYQISIGFLDSIRGLKTRITAYRNQLCALCRGDGRAAAQRDVPCPTCHGSGQMKKTKGPLQFGMSCLDCGGTGKLARECPECSGEGRTPVSEMLDVDIPPGVSSGSRVRFPGKGDVGRLGAPAGDLYIVTNVAPHPFFERAGDNIQCTVPITFWEAALGAKIEVPTIDGAAVVRIPPGSQNGQTFRMREKGAPSLLQPGRYGDQFVKIRVVTPNIADERSKEILRELARLNPDDPRSNLKKP